MAAKLGRLTTIDLSSREIAEQFALPLLEMRRQRRAQPPPAVGSDAPNAARRPVGPGFQRANAVLSELGEQKILRAVYSDRQLQEVLTDFWFNHFNVDARKGQSRFLLTEYERDAIRPHVFGRFRDLLGTTAKSPAMLFYLDNWMSSDPNTAPPVARARPGRGRVLRPSGVQPPQQPPERMRRGLNENYARELMELHTLGVDGGYTQKDVTEVARAFTGWTIENPRAGGAFRFEPRMHDKGEKIVLGQRIGAGGGMDDGEQVLDVLASHPSTARFIALQARAAVCQRRAASVARRPGAARFRDTQGDLREVTREILTSPEFLAPAAHGIKVKTPFEFVVSAVRATGTDVRTPQLSSERCSSLECRSISASRRPATKTRRTPGRTQERWSTA